MKQLALTLMCVLFLVGIHAQDTIPEQKPAKEKKGIGDKLFVGGTVGLSFGSYSRVAIYPYIGLQVNKKFRTAFQVGYEYVRNTSGSVDYSGSNYGFSLWAQYHIFKSLYVHAEPGYYNFDGIWNAEGDDRFWVPFFFAGAGLHKRIGGRSMVYVQVKFDLINDSNSPYEDWAPFFDIGVAVGI